MRWSEHCRFAASRRKGVSHLASFSLCRRLEEAYTSQICSIILILPRRTQLFNQDGSRLLIRLETFFTEQQLSIFAA